MRPTGAGAFPVPRQDIVSTDLSAYPSLPATFPKDGRSGWAYVDRTYNYSFDGSDMTARLFAAPAAHSRLCLSARPAPEGGTYWNESATADRIGKARNRVGR